MPKPWTEDELDIAMRYKQEIYKGGRIYFNDAARELARITGRTFNSAKGVIRRLRKAGKKKCPTSA